MNIIYYKIAKQLQHELIRRQMSVSRERAPHVSRPQLTDMFAAECEQGVARKQWRQNLFQYASVEFTSCSSMVLQVYRYKWISPRINLRLGIVYSLYTFIPYRPFLGQFGLLGCDWKLAFWHLMQAASGATRLEFENMLGILSAPSQLPSHNSTQYQSSQQCPVCRGPRCSCCWCIDCGHGLLCSNVHQKDASTRGLLEALFADSGLFCRVKTSWTRCRNMMKYVTCKSRKAFLGFCLFGSLKVVYR